MLGRGVTGAGHDVAARSHRRLGWDRPEETWTDRAGTAPDHQSPPGVAFWRGPSPGVAVFTDDDGVDLAEIPVTVTRVRWKEPP